MELQINRWGNSLAVRLPAALVRQLGLHEGSKLNADLTQMGELRLSPQEPMQPAKSRAELLAQILKLHEGLPITQPVAREEWSRY